MARPSRCRRICEKPKYCEFGPYGKGESPSIALTLDEYEAVRLIDLENKTQEQCAAQMDISRTTVMEIYSLARRKIADCIVNGKPMAIEGGNYRFCDGSARCYCQKSLCRNQKDTTNQSTTKEKKGTIMKIAVTYENGEVFQHFGHSRQFKLYEIENGQVVNSQIISAEGQGHGALAALLSTCKVSALICGGIGGGAQTALAQAGIEVYGGVKGNADEAARLFALGKLSYDPQVKCTHHQGEHSCAENKQGCQGSQEK